MKYLIYILLSLSLAAVSPVVAGEKKGPIDDLQKGADNISAETSEDISSDMSGHTTDSDETMNGDMSCKGPAVIEMPAVGIYAPLLEPLHKPKMSKAKAKKKKANKEPVEVIDTLKQP